MAVAAQTADATGGADPEGTARSSRLSALTRRVAVPRWAVGLTILVVAGLAVMLWSVLDSESTYIAPFELGSFEELLPTIAGATQSQILEGNAVEVIQDGAFFDRVIADVEAAESTVHYETFVWWRGDVCRRLADAFVDAARRGVEVRLLVDAWGGRKMEETLRRRMVDAGVHLAEFRPPKLDNLGLINNRDHRKLAIVDGRVGYAFGHGVAQEWAGEGPVTWQDTAIRVRGPLVAALQSTFAENWMSTTGGVLAGEEVFPELEPAGEVRGHVVASSNPGSLSTVRLLYKLAIASAEEEILVQNPYFAPDSAVVDLLCAAAERGVRVRIMLPGPEAADSKIVLHASHTRYGDLLEAGVEILEYHPALLHKKIMVVDRLWSHVGSTNFDSRSLEINDEVSVGLIDPEIAGVLVAEFEGDAEHSGRVDPQRWDRPWHHRLLDRAAATLQEQL